MRERLVSYGFVLALAALACAATVEEKNPGIFSEPQTADGVFADALWALSSAHPLPAPLVVSVEACLPDHYGTCEWDEDAGQFLIRVEETIAPDWQVDILIHEYAHALSWDAGCARERSHSAYWGVAYWQAYTAVH